MKYLPLALLLFAFCSCGYLGDNEVILEPVIEEIENTDAGTLLVIGTDGGRDLDLVGVEYRVPGAAFLLQNQFVVEAGSDSLLLTGLQDGTYEFRAFVASGDYYGYSGIVTHEVVSPTPDIPCDPTPNVTRANLSDINCTNVRVTSELGFRGTFEVEIGCYTGQPIRLRFPREPSSGVYKTTTVNVEDVDSASRLVTIRYQTAFSGNFGIKAGEKVYVQRTPDNITITLCDIDASNARFSSARITGRYVLDR